MTSSVASLTLEEVESEIEAIYRWWHDKAPGVHPREVGRLADLWRVFDMKVGR